MQHQRLGDCGQYKTRTTMLKLESYQLDCGAANLYDDRDTNEKGEVVNYRAGDAAKWRYVSNRDDIVEMRSTRVASV